jgi:carbon-monoxide dehydrogenase large subunit
MGPIAPNWVLPGTSVPDRPVVAVDRVRFVGECVALTVVETREAAYDARDLINVTYDPLPAVVDEAEAIDEGAPQLHGNVRHNITTHFKVGGGDYAEAARRADQVLRLRLVNNRLIPTCLDTRAILAEPGDDGTLASRTARIRDSGYQTGACPAGRTSSSYGPPPALCGLAPGLHSQAARMARSQAPT